MRACSVSADVDLVSTEEFISKAPAHLKVLVGSSSSSSSSSTVVASEIQHLA